MSDHDTKYCPHCRARYRTILDTCVYCNGHMRTIPWSPGNPEFFLIIVNLTAMLLVILAALK